MHRWIPLSLLIVLCYLPLSIQAHDTSLPNTQNPFGIVEGMWFPDLTCELNPGWERIIFSWSDHQPNSQNDWFPFFNIPDEWLQAANDCNREVVAVIKSTPAWATDGSPGAGVPRGLYLPIDDPANVWATFMRRTAEYYASRGITRFIIWNEPDIKPGVYGFEFEGAVEDYFMLVKVAYLAAKQSNPAARIHLAGTTFWHDANSGERLYTDRLLEQITKDPEAAQHNYYFDALSLHIYFRTDTVYEIVNNYRDLLNEHGLGEKAIWITETNASPNLDPDWPVTRPQFQITLDQQANYVIQAAALGLAAGAERIAVYKLFDQQLPPGGESFGLLRPQSSPDEPIVRRPAYHAWKTVIQHFTGISQIRFAQNERVNLIQIIHSDQRQAIVSWSRFDRTTQLEITATSSKAALVDLYGNVQIIRPNDQAYTIDLPAAQCEKEEGCVIGGTPIIFIQPTGNTQFTEITPQNRYELTLE